jgi:beta-galactosidase GanA
MNFQATPQTIDLGQANYQDMLSDQGLTGSLTIPGYGLRILRPQ